LLRAEVESLRKLVLRGRRVDLVDFGELKAFLYTDDIGYQMLAPEYKGHAPGKEKRDLSQPRRTPDERYDNEGEPLLPVLLSHYWVNDLDFVFLNIGCQYGISAMATAQVILSSGRANQVVAFDPGVAAQLAPVNIALNGLEGRVVYERTAIGNGTFPVIVFTETGHSETTASSTGRRRRKPCPTSHPARRWTGTSPATASASSWLSRSTPRGAKRRCSKG